MKVLLINPNRAVFPPVPPIGLEYILASLIRGGHEARLLDLTFEDEATAIIDETISSFMPDICGVTVRNIDSVLFHDNEFYLDGISEIVHILKTRYFMKVIIGGAGIVCNPEAVLDHIGADYAVAGPAEGVINNVLAEIGCGRAVKRVWQGYVLPYSSCSRFTSATDYQKYYASGGVAGFETHKGCSASCVYCLEANSPVVFKQPRDIIQELSGFVEAGHSRFHLCDAEFNEDLDHAVEFCAVLKQENMGIQWSLYMKPANYNQRLFRLMKETGVNLVTLTVDSFRKCSLYWADIEKIIFCARSSGTPVVIDFLTGFPYEDRDLLCWCLDFFRRLQPDRVNINTFIRLYKPLMITKIIEKDRALRANILGDPYDKAMIMPVFYNHTDTQWLREAVSGDRIFRIEGDEKGCNYMRA